MILGIDGNAIDMATVLAGVISICVRPVRCAIKKTTAWKREKVVVDFLNGASIVPFAVMLGSTFWTSLLEEVMKSKISLGLAGAVGFLFIAAEILNAGNEKTSGDGSQG